MYSEDENRMIDEGSPTRDVDGEAQERQRASTQALGELLARLERLEAEVSALAEQVKRLDATC